MTEQEALLVQLMEECSELIREATDLSIRAAKGLRFGLTEIQPGQLWDNRQRLLGELADVYGVATALNLHPDKVAVEAKREKIRKYMGYSIALNQVVKDPQNDQTPDERRV